MAEQILIAGEQYLKRRPIVVLLLTIVTLLVYWVIWYYKINDEARRYLGDRAIKPYWSVLAIVPGAVLLLVPPIISIYRTGRRIERMQSQAAVAKRIHPLTGCVCAILTSITLIFAGGTGYYYQTQLNRVWTAGAPAPRQPRGGPK